MTSAYAFRYSYTRINHSNALMRRRRTKMTKNAVGSVTPEQLARMNAVKERAQKANGVTCHDGVAAHKWERILEVEKQSNLNWCNRCHGWYQPLHPTGAELNERNRQKAVKEIQMAKQAHEHTSVEDIVGCKECNPQGHDAKRYFELRDGGFDPKDDWQDVNAGLEEQPKKPWHQMTAEEREAIRAERRAANGGAECSQCGNEDYEDNMTKVDGVIYCEECFQVKAKDDFDKLNPEDCHENL